jgi:asparagine synthase (glutamine-hydrolysing)
MCGVCGVLRISDNFPISDEIVLAMRDSMIHRGPDDGGNWLSADHRVALGHRRLSIVDLSSAGHQPMSNEDGTVWVTYNGEIYNHRQLRAQLEAAGHVYRSQTDTETIIHLYEDEGPRCVERLHGMFAFGIWDSRKRELFLARDRLGIKPLYYTHLPGGFLFASEIKALLGHPSVTAELDEEAFFHYLTFASTPAPLTMFRGIRKLAPAERMIVGMDGRTRSDFFWDPLSEARAEEIALLSDADLEERLLTLLRSSIAKRMMADVPFGVFLSGGIDSSTNVALMSELMDEPVRTFSVAFKDHGRYNELEHARTIAKRYATDHHEVIIDDGDFRGFLPELIYHQDEPIADPVCVPLHFVSRLARESGTIVVQVGEGSDELLHGYQSYVDHARLMRLYWEPLRKSPRPVRIAAGYTAAQLSSRLGRGLHYATAITNAAEGRLSFWGGFIPYHGRLKQEVLTNGRVHPDSYEVVAHFWHEAERRLPRADLLQKMTYLELKQRLAELLLMRVDKMTMATSVEARVPFLDHELVEFAIALPSRLKVRNGVGKYLLKRAVEGLLPREIVYRPKQGFGAPIAEWFRGEFGRRAQREIRDSSLSERGLLNYDRVDDLWDAHRSGANWNAQLWNVYNVSAWHDYWIAGINPG